MTPSVMVNAELHQRVHRLVRARPTSRATCAPRTTSSRPGTSGATWCGGSSTAPPRRCWRSSTSAPCATPTLLPPPSGSLAREQGKVLAASAWSARSRSRVGRPVQDVAPLGSTAGGARACGARCTPRPSSPLDGTRPKFTLEVVHLDRPSAWRLDAPPAMPERRPTTPRGIEGRRIEHARPVRRALTWPLIPKRSSTRAAPIGEIPPWKFYDLEHRSADGLRLQGRPRSRQDHLDDFRSSAPGHVRLRRAGPRAVVRPRRRRDRAATTNDASWRRSGVVPAARNAELTRKH